MRLQRRCPQDPAQAESAAAHSGRPEPDPAGAGQLTFQRDQVHRAENRCRDRTGQPRGRERKYLLDQRQRRRVRPEVRRQALWHLPTIAQRGSVQGNRGGTGPDPAHRGPARRSGLGRRQTQRRRVVLFHLAQRKGMTMTEPNAVEVLLVEDNPHDAELMTRELKKRNLANNLVWVKDGAAALDLLFGTDPQAGGEISHRPKVILLDLKLPKVDGVEVLRQLDRKS